MLWGIICYYRILEQKYETCNKIASDLAWLHKRKNKISLEITIQLILIIYAQIILAHIHHIYNLKKQ